MYPCQDTKLKICSMDVDAMSKTLKKRHSNPKNDLILIQHKFLPEYFLHLRFGQRADAYWDLRLRSADVFGQRPGRDQGLRIQIKEKKTKITIKLNISVTSVTWRWLQKALLFEKKRIFATLIPIFVLNPLTLPQGKSWKTPLGFRKRTKFSTKWYIKPCI